MYAALASAGASQLYDLYKSITGGSSSTSTSSTSFDPTSDASSSSTGVQQHRCRQAVLDQLQRRELQLGSAEAVADDLTDLQASTSATTSTASTSSSRASTTRGPPAARPIRRAPSPTIGHADGVQGLEDIGAHGHHHHAGPPPNASPDDSQSASTDPPSSSTRHGLRRPRPRPRLRQRPIRSRIWPRRCSPTRRPRACTSATAPPTTSDLRSPACSTGSTATRPGVHSHPETRQKLRRASGTSGLVLKR